MNFQCTTQVAKESAELNRELQALERQSVLSNQCTGSVNEALQLYEQNKVHDMFQGKLFESIFFDSTMMHHSLLI